MNNPPPTPNFGNPWLTANPIDSWHGIETNEVGCVTTIALQNNNLTGTLSNLDLPELEILVLNEDNLTGNIPDFSTTPFLKILSLGDNNLNGNVPNFVLALLEVLVLEKNQLSGNIPDLNGMPLLTFLDLDENQLTGTLLDFSNLDSVVSL